MGNQDEGMFHFERFFPHSPRPCDGDRTILLSISRANCRHLHRDHHQRASSRVGTKKAIVIDCVREIALGAVADEAEMVAVAGTGPGRVHGALDLSLRLVQSQLKLLFVPEAGHFGTDAESCKEVPFVPDHLPFHHRGYDGSELLMVGA